MSSNEQIKPRAVQLPIGFQQFVTRNIPQLCLFTNSTSIHGIHVGHSYMTHPSILEIAPLSSDPAQAKLLLCLIKRELINNFFIQLGETAIRLLKVIKIKFLETLGVSFQFQTSQVRSLIRVLRLPPTRLRAIERKPNCDKPYPTNIVKTSFGAQYNFNFKNQVFLF